MESEFTLPWPPSVNRIWRSKRGKNGGPPIVYLNSFVQAYRKRVRDVFLRGPKPWYGSDKKLHVELLFYPPNLRRRDIDNLAKQVCDSLEKVGVFENDSQIDELVLVRKHVTKGGRVEVKINTIDP